MSIFPLPQFEADVAEYLADKEAYEKLSVPKTIVVRFGAMKLIGEYPYDGTAKPGCGSKLVVRTHRGTELAEMLTSTCPNAGCSKSVSRQEILKYIDNSGGEDYPFYSEGRILRIATIEDMNAQRAAEARKNDLRRRAQKLVEEQMLAMKIVDAEPILGGERLTFYFTSEDRIDFRDLVGVLSREFASRIELRQVGARDEARLIADYEKCGQHCCCKQFLKVLKPVSMKSAKIQKATLDPLKISGRCGRLMCCLRYEDETYDSLRKKLPRMKSRVGTPHGTGIVIDAQILTQLVLVLLESENKQVAVPVEELTAPDAPPPPPKTPSAGERAPSPRPQGATATPDPLRGMSPEQVAKKTGEPGTQAGAQRDHDRSRQQDRYRDQSKNEGRRDDRPPQQTRPQGQGQGGRPPREQQQPQQPRDRRPPQSQPPREAVPEASSDGPWLQGPEGPAEPGAQQPHEGQQQRQGRGKRRRRRGRRGPGGGPGTQGGPGGNPGGSPPQ